MDEVTLGELRRNFTDLKTYIGNELRTLREDMVYRDVYTAEQDHLKGRIKSLEETRARLIGTVAALTVALLAQIVYVLLASAH